MPLLASITTQRRLSGPERDAMLHLHRTSFDNVDHVGFMADLAEKDWVIRLHDHAGDLVGFSTQKLIPLRVSGTPFRFLFSGDTVVARAHRNTPLLAGCFGHLLLRLLDDRDPAPLYWFLISKGYRTYRFMPVFFNRYWPTPWAPTPKKIASLLHAIAEHKFGDSYDRRTGIIRPRNGDCLTATDACVTASRRLDPDVAFFLSRNPGYARGDELACLAPVSRENLNAHADRVIRATNPGWTC